MRLQPGTGHLAREVRLAQRSWFQFFDAELQAEWLGVYDDTPAPPVEAWRSCVLEHLMSRPAAEDFGLAPGDGALERVAL